MILLAGARDREINKPTKPVAPLTISSLDEGAIPSVSIYKKGR